MTRILAFSLILTIVSAIGCVQNNSGSDDEVKAALGLTCQSTNKVPASNRVLSWRQGATDGGGELSLSLDADKGSLTKTGVCLDVPVNLSEIRALMVGAEFCTGTIGDSQLSLSSSTTGVTAQPASDESVKVQGGWENLRAKLKAIESTVASSVLCF